MSYLIFNQKISNKKPNTIRNKEIICPFCNRQLLAKIHSQVDDVLLVANKFPTIAKADMFVVVETKTCQEDVFNYSCDKYTKILEFAIDNWLHLKNDPDYVEAILHKNYGPLSGGSIKHEHMQIVGFKKKKFMIN